MHLSFIVGERILKPICSLNAARENVMVNVRSLRSGVKSVLENIRFF